MRLVSVALSLVLTGAGIGAQAALPSNYKIQFENAWVRVTGVRYAALEKVAPHSHTPSASAYVYLNDGPPVIFRHVGGAGIVAKRAATKAGAFRVYKGLEEIHEVENTGNAPSEFLRVELKTAAAEPENFRGKFERPAAASAEAVVQFNHPQLRISRLWVTPGQSNDVAAGGEPALIIALANGSALKIGEVKWIDASTSARFSNASPAPIDLLRFDFKTRPMKTRQ